MDKNKYSKSPLCPSLILKLKICPPTFINWKLNLRFLELQIGLRFSEVLKSNP